MKYIVKKVTKKTKINLDNLKEEIKEKILINKKVHPTISLLEDKTIKEKGIEDIIDNIFNYTHFLENIPFAHRINFILNNVIEIKKCECGEVIKKLRIRNGKVSGFNDYCSQSCANRYTNYKKSEEFYREVAKKIVKTRRKNDSYIPHDNFKYRLRDKEKFENFKKICLKKYGVENPGVLGAYSSKSAEEFIRNYIKENNIDENKCYFKNGGINNKEYFQQVFSTELNKYIYFSYDLIVLNDKKEIELVLEYNGPWHHTLKEVKISPNEPASPYPNSKTKQETYNFDILKLNHIKQKTNNILIYWLKTKKLIKYNGRL